jgi:PAS domain-containing protein
MAVPWSQASVADRPLVGSRRVRISGSTPSQRVPARNLGRRRAERSRPSAPHGRLIQWISWLAANVIADSRCMPSDEHQPLLLILARNLVTNLALPAPLTDADQRLIFFNEAAALIFGQSFEEVGRLRRDEWATRLGPFGKDGRPVAIDSLPLAVALREGRPSQGRFRVRAHDD